MLREPAAAPRPLSEAQAASRPAIGIAVGLAIVMALLSGAPLSAGDLRNELGRNDIRIYSGVYRIEPGRTVAELDLAGRLETRGYTRVRGRRPESPGEYFWGHEKFWIFRPAVRIGGQKNKSRLIGLRLRRSDGLVLEGLAPDETPLSGRHLWLAPTLLAESFDPGRSPTVWLDFEQLPEVLWQAVLAAEDARFFDHVGIDARSLARAMLANAKAGGVVQGGSTITQQLIKIRDLSPKRSLGRKVSEAVRALSLEAEYDKTEILEAYLNAVYFGHVGGIHVYGVGRAARTYFSKPANELDLDEAAVLAAVIQGPNRLSPVRNPETLEPRYQWVLSRLEELGWADETELAAARRRLPELDVETPPRPEHGDLLDWLESDVERRAPKLSQRDRGVVIHSTLDSQLQRAAEAAVSRGLRRIERSRRELRGRDLGAALVALDPRSGDVLAYVGTDPEDPSDAFDRARLARRQPGSTVKPLVLLEAFESCGKRAPLYPARRVRDTPLTLDLPSGAWSPANPDGDFHEVVTLRAATINSLNVPFVRAARWCGFGEVAERMRRAGLDLPPDPGPAFVLGALETSPLSLAAAYTPIAAGGRRARPRPWSVMQLPSGESLDRRDISRRRVGSRATAYLVRDMLSDAMRDGTAAAGAFGDAETLNAEAAFGKTGTSSNSRDAWFAGGAGSIVAVVWVGLDEGTLGLSGTRAAAPIWKDFMAAAVPLRPAGDPSRPRKVVERWIQTETGLLTSRERKGTVLELFRAGKTPPKRRIWRRDEPIPPIE